MPTLSLSATRIIRIIDVLASHPEGMRVSALAQAVGLNRSTAHRLVATLAKDSWAVRVAGGPLFTLGPGLLAFCQRALSGTNLISVLLPFASELTELSGETTHVGILLNYKIVHVAQVRSKTQLGVASDVGAVGEAYCTSLGKVLLARCSDSYLKEYLDHVRLVPQTPRTILDRDRLIEEINRVRIAGFALDHEESSVGIVCLGVGICGDSPESAIAMSIMGPSRRLSLKRAAQFAPRAIEISGRAAAALVNTFPNGTGVAVRGFTAVR